MRWIPIYVLSALVLNGCPDRSDRSGEGSAHFTGAIDCDDAGMPEDAATSDDAGPAVSPGPKRVFITSETFEADMTAYARQDTGLSSADVVCQQVAITAGLEGRFIAWMSDERHDAIDRIRGDGPFVRMDGEVLFPDHESLAGLPLAPLNVNEYGEASACDGSSSSKVWTGTRTGGGWGLFDCVGWTSRDGDFEAVMGENCSIERWTGRPEPRDCNSAYRLYCFEQ